MIKTTCSVDTVRSQCCLWERHLTIRMSSMQPPSPCKSILPLPMGFIQLKSQLYLQHVQQHISFLLSFQIFLSYFLPPSAFFPSGTDLPERHVPRCVTSQGSSQELVQPLVPLGLHPALSLIIQGFKNIPPLTAVLNVVIF